LISATIVSAAYVAFQMIADIASLRIVTLGGFSIDGGTFIYPFTFTLRDMVHKTAGIKAARALIVAAAVLNLIMAGVFWLVANLLPDMAVGPQEEFGMVLSPLIITLLRNIDQTTAAGSTPPNAIHTKIRLSMGILMVLLTNTLAHW